MEIYLMRHAIAADAADLGLDSDDARPLTADGAERMRQCAAGMKRLGLQFDRIWTSPLLRARQTAEIAAEALGLGARLEETDLLGHGFSCGAVAADLARQPKNARLLLVGHQPDMGELIQYFATSHGELNIDVKKASLCLIQFDSAPVRGAGWLIWHLSPSVLRELSKP